MKVLYKIIDVRETVLYHNEKDKPMYGAIIEDFDYVKKVMI